MPYISQEYFMIQKATPISILFMVESEKIDEIIKETGHDFCWSENPIYHIERQGNILYISKQITKSP